MTVGHLVRAATLVERLTRRVGVYVHDDEVLRSRVDRLLAAVGLPASEVEELERRLLNALGDAGITVTDDTSDSTEQPSLTVPAQRDAMSSVAGTAADALSSIDLESSRTAALRLLTDASRRHGVLSAAEEVGLAVL